MASIDIAQVIKPLPMRQTSQAGGLLHILIALLPGQLSDNGTGKATEGGSTESMLTLRKQGKVAM